MERQKDIARPAKVSVAIIILFHLVGLVGLSVPSLRPLFLQIVPWHILLMLLVMILNHKWLNWQLIVFAIFVIVSGFGLEWLGVHKYWLFGDYNYGETLGYKLFDIPLTIGVNWFLLIYATGVLMQRSRLKSKWAKVLLGAVLLVLLDLLIEPVAMHLDYWDWDFHVVPLKNYICWFGVSFMFLWVFELFNFKKQNIAPPVLLFTEFVFFGILNLLVR
ncbi:carotenoid biosynthesis protein [Mucilaginibacter litoreus]|uniref:Carotenoid biosynthesis protein n=1 Tax=Mucilaginibacter litoreus TaxID=1048221 RepID=A0ABW3AT91_9SPHI